MGNIAILAGGDSTPAKRSHVYMCWWWLFQLLRNKVRLRYSCGGIRFCLWDRFAPTWTQAKQVVQSVPERTTRDLELALKVAFEAHPDAACHLFMCLLAVAWITCPISFAGPSTPSSFLYRKIQLVDGQNRLIYRPAGCHEIQPDPALCPILVHACWRMLEITGAKDRPSENHFFEGHVWPNEFFDQTDSLFWS